MFSRKVLVPVVVAAILGGLLGYALGHERNSNEVKSAPSSDGVRLRQCPPSAWARGGGTDYARVGMSCHDVNEFVLHDFASAGATTEGRALAFGGWVCFQRQTAGRYSPVLNVCADGRRKLRFLFH